MTDRTDSTAEPPTPDTDRDAVFERDVLAALPAVARFARSLTRDAAAADDLVQDTFLLAYRFHHTFHAGEDVLRWLFTICRRAWMRDSMRNQRMVTTEDGTDAELDTLAAVYGHAAAKRAGEDALFERLDLAPAIETALGELPAPFRVAVGLVDVEGFSYDDAAAMEGVPVGTIRSRLFRGRRLLQERLLDFARDAGYSTAHPALTPIAPRTTITPRRQPRRAATGTPRTDQTDD